MLTHRIASAKPQSENKWADPIYCVERGELRTEAPAEADRVSDHSFTNPRFSR
jgi:hypothetical protein